MADKIAFLHTAQVHVATFTALLRQLDSQVLQYHRVDESLLADATDQGFSPALQQRITEAMLACAGQGAEVVVCTCSTIGGIAELAGVGHQFHSLRIDRAMADGSVRAGKDILLLAALTSTLQPTTELIQDSARRLKKPAKITAVEVDGAWQHFEAGNQSLYWQSIADAITSRAADYDVVVLAQASMAGAAELASGVAIPVLTSPRLGVINALNLLKNS